MLENKELEEKLKNLIETRAVLMSYKQEAFERLGEKYYRIYREE